MSNLTPETVWRTLGRQRQQLAHLHAIALGRLDLGRAAQWAIALDLLAGRLALLRASLRPC